MASSPGKSDEPPGAAFDKFFDSVSKKAENLTLNDKSSGFPNGSSQDEGIQDGEQKVVEEISSLCMNCHEDVRLCDIIKLHTDEQF